MKDNTVVCGIYAIINIVNGRCYIGSSKDIHSHYQAHVWELSKKKHDNPKLQAAWDKYGPSAFILIILRSVPLRTLLYVEQFFLDTFTPSLNCNMNAFRPPITKRSESSLIASSERMKLLWQDPVYRQKVTEAVKGPRGKYRPRRKPVSQEHRAKIAAAKLGKKRPKFSAEWLANIKAAHARCLSDPEQKRRLYAAKRKPRSAEHREMMSKMMKEFWSKQVNRDKRLQQINKTSQKGGVV